MAEQITLAAVPRTVLGKQNRQLRRDGLTPIVLYGRHIEPVSLQVETRALQRVLSHAGGTNLIAITVAGEAGARMALAKDVQRHVTRLHPLHADFIEVQMDVPITVEVPVVVEGEPDLVRTGDAMIEILVNSLTVEALPAHLPESVHLNVADLADLHAAIRVSDIDLGAGVRLLDDPDMLVVHLSSTAAAMAASATMEASASAVIEAGLAAGPAAEPEAPAPDDEEE
jgi:large subunit ribosomal protein L25